MKKFAKIAIIIMMLAGIVLSFASCSFFTPSFEEMCANLADENYICVYSYDKDETADYDEQLEEKYDINLKGEVTARAEYTSGTTFIRLYEFKKKNDAMAVQQELYDEFMNGTHYGSGYIYRYYYIVDSILIETSSQSAAEAALAEAFVLVDLPNAKTEDVMDYFTSLFN